jgi:hypothetical protein
MWLQCNHMEHDQSVIPSERTPRQGWKETFAAAGPSADDSSPFDSLQNKFDDEEWTW